MRKSKLVEATKTFDCDEKSTLYNEMKKLLSHEEIELNRSSYEEIFMGSNFNRKSVVRN
jgi:hypothetical protein